MQKFVLGYIKVCLGIELHSNPEILMHTVFSHYQSKISIG